jgi:hypothetical protein
MIYGRQGNSDLFVNLLIPSTLSWQARRSHSAPTSPARVMWNM